MSFGTNSNRSSSPVPGDGTRPLDFPPGTGDDCLSAEPAIESTVDYDEFDDSAETTAVFSQQELQTHIAVPASRRSFVLLRVDGSELGQVLTLTSTEISVGRHHDNDIQLAQEGISRRHARFVFVEGGYVLEDLGSANGTFVAGDRIDKTRLEDGDVIQFGPRVAFRYSVTDAAQEQMLRQLYEASVRDPLTGAYNREYLRERLLSEVAFARRHGTQTSLVLLDVDHFKNINDTYGHQAGDFVLVNLVRLWTHTLRTEDTFARYGGEEFAISLRGIGLDGAARVAERLRTAAAARPMVYKSHSIRCTVSAGCSAITCCPEPTVEQLVATADRRLYTAKRSGRDRVVSHG